MPDTHGALFRPPEQTNNIPVNSADIIIQRKDGWNALDLRDLWHYRELFFFLTWRDVRIRYKQTALGVSWVILQPLLSTLVMTIFLGRFARVPSDGVPYSVFVYAGLLPWAFFSSAVISSGNSLVGNANLITKVYFPRMIIPASAVAARLFDFIIGFAAMSVFILYYRLPLHPTVLFLPLLILLLAVVAFALGAWFSAVNVRYRDVGVALPVLIQIWMFASPIVYPSSIVNTKSATKLVYMLNPLVGIVENIRAVIFGRPFNWTAAGIAGGIAVLFAAFSIYNFQRMERNFADRI